MFPAFVNCTTIDWFSEWPADALLEVADKYLQEVQIGAEDEVWVIYKNLSSLIKIWLSFITQNLWCWTECYVECKLFLCVKYRNNYLWKMVLMVLYWEFYFIFALPCDFSTKLCFMYPILYRALFTQSSTIIFLNIIFLKKYLLYRESLNCGD